MKTWRALRYWLVVAAISAAQSGCRPDADSDSNADPAPETTASALTIVLGAEQRAKLGVSTTSLEQATFEQRVEGIGVVLEVQPIVQIMADLTSAEAAVTQSRAAAARAAALFEADAAVSREVLEMAQRQAASDEASVAVARAEAVVAFGAAAPWLDPARRQQILRQLTDGASAVVRTSFPGGLPEALPVNMTLRPVGDALRRDAWTASRFWLGPADPAVPGPVMLAYVEAAQGLVAGGRVAASIATGSREDGIVIPGSAVVFAGGTAWCYLADGDSFARTAVDLARPLRDGYFQSTGFVAGGEVVTAGAGLLLALETGGGEGED
jgi:hypothetical protein